MRLAAGAALFVILATANSGGYRYGISDQAFYVPAMAHYVDATLFPRDAVLLEAQTSRTPAYRPVRRARADTGRPACAVRGAVPGHMIGLAVAVWFYGRALGGSAWASAAALALLTFRHRIAKTGANSLEGYFHPRMLAFAIGIAALACVLRRRLWAALVLAMARRPRCIPPRACGLLRWSAWRSWRQLNRTAIWADGRSDRSCRRLCGLAVAGLRLDETWRSVLLEKDYLFPLAVAGLRVGAESALSTVTCSHLPAAPRARTRWRRVSRCFWPACSRSSQDSCCPFRSRPGTSRWLCSCRSTASSGCSTRRSCCTSAWWLMDDLAVRRGRAWRTPLLAAVVLLSAVRGFYVLAIETKRPLVQASLPAGDWRTR